MKVDAEDGNSPYITPPLGFPFMGRLYERVFVSGSVRLSPEGSGSDEVR